MSEGPMVGYICWQEQGSIASANLFARTFKEKLVEHIVNINASLFIIIVRTGESAGVRMLVAGNSGTKRVFVSEGIVLPAPHLTAPVFGTLETSDTLDEPYVVGGMSLMPRLVA